MIFLKKQQLKQFKYFIQYIFAITIFAIIKPLPLKLIAFFSRFLGRTIVYFCLKHFQKTRFEIFKKNLQIIQKQQLNNGEYSKLFKQYCSYVTTLFLTTIHEKKLTKQWLERNVSNINISDIVESYKNGDKIIIFSAHFGNWEIAQNYLAKVCKLPLTMLFRAQNNSKLSKIFDTRRRNIHMIDKRDKAAMRHMLKSLQNNRIVVVLLDQKDTKNGSPIEFFGKKAMLPTAMARIAIKSQAKVFTCVSTASNFEISCNEISNAHNFANEIELTKEIFTTFEDWISKNPTNWYCLTHNIWKE